MLKKSINGLKKQEVNQKILVDIFKTLLEYRVMCSDQKHVNYMYFKCIFTSTFYRLLMLIFLKLRLQ